ncbi:MAG: hypothetical protein SVM80_04520 [Halobacteriota archaeon]|nr:hypothetical protein [Halobacteriota archaeon]
MKKITITIITFLLVFSLLTPNVLAKSNFEETYRSDVPDTAGVNELVNIRIVLEEVSSQLTTQTNLTFTTALKDPTWNFRFVGFNAETTKAGSREEVKVTFNHTFYDNITISLTGVSPTYEKRKTILLMDIEQNETDGNIKVIKSIWLDITTGDIEDVRNAIEEAKEAIDGANETMVNASGIGVNVNDASVKLDLAKWHLGESNRLYTAEDTESSLKYAIYARDNATDALNLTNIKITEFEEHQDFIELRNYGIMIGTIMAVVIVVVMLYRGRAWDKLGR